jgi:uncharacterized protein (TIGR01244 family)
MTKPCQLDDQILVSGQVAPEDVAGLAAEGITVIVNNRPDDEDQGQPAGSDIEAAAERAGIEYHFVPIARGIGPADIQAMQQAIAAAGDGKLLAFCRSGTRSALTCALARKADGASREEVVRMLQQAGFDPAPIAHLL